MLDRESVLKLFEEASSALVFNLDFIPEGKMAWKPAPEARSVLEIVNHLAPYLDSVSRALGAPDQAPAAPVGATNRDQARQVLARSAECWARAVRGATSEVLGQKFREDMPLALGWMVTASAIDTIHHAGQVAYIQTLLGDNELHFDESKLPDWAVS